jgi:hypothetical protein
MTDPLASELFGFDLEDIREPFDDFGFLSLDQPAEVAVRIPHGRSELSEVSRAKFAVFVTDKNFLDI